MLVLVEDHKVDTAPREVIADRQPGLATTNDDGVDLLGGVAVVHAFIWAKGANPEIERDSGVVDGHRISSSAADVVSPSSLGSDGGARIAGINQFEREPVW